MKKHLKRLAIPKSWAIKRRGITFVVRPNPGPHSFKLALPLRVILRDVLAIAKNAKEVRNSLYYNEVLVDGIRRKESKFPVGIMDVIKFGDNCFRIALKKGKLVLIMIDKKEADIKPCKIIGKSKVKGKTQLNLYDGKNIIVDKDDYKVGGTVLISLPKNEIKEYMGLEQGCLIYLIGGKHSGDIGKVEDIISNKIIYKMSGGETIETLKKYVFVVGKDKPVVSLAGKE